MFSAVVCAAFAYSFWKKEVELVTVQSDSDSLEVRLAACSTLCTWPLDSYFAAAFSGCEKEADRRWQVFSLLAGHETRGSVAMCSRGINSNRNVSE